MPVIATNIYKKLNNTQKAYLREIGEPLEITDIVEYVTKSKEGSEDSRFIIDKLNIRNIIKDSSKWSSLEQLVCELVEISIKNTSATETQFWIRDVETTPVLNISYSLINKDDVNTLMTSLSNFLSKEMDYINKLEEKKLVWIAYDIEKQEWKMTIL